MFNNHRLKQTALIFLMLVLSSMLQVQVYADTPKAWETDDYIIKEPKGFHIRLQKNFDRNAEPKSFRALVHNRYDNTQVDFSGTCNELMTMRVTAGDARKLDLERFKETHAGKDLPLSELLKLSQETLSGQCEQLQVIRLEFTPRLNSDPRKDFRYEGTMTKASGWKLMDGIVQTDYDHTHKFELTSRDFFSTVGVIYKGGCEEVPVLPLAPMYANMQEQTFAKPPTWGNFLIFAKAVSQGYIKQCPNTKFIKYSISPIPEKYECNIDTGCFVTTSKEDNWEAEYSEFSIKKPEKNPIPDILAMADILAREDYDVLHEYQNYFAFFFENFIALYSDNCRENIKNPVGRKIQIFDVKTVGGVVDSVEEGAPPRYIYIEPKYVDLFDRYHQSWKMWAVNKYMNSVLKNQERGRGPVESTQWAMGFFTGNINKLDRMIMGSCNSEHVQTVYRNMHTYASMKKPMNPKVEAVAKDLQKLNDWIGGGFDMETKTTQPTREPSKSAPPKAAPSVKKAAPNVQQSIPENIAPLIGVWTATIAQKPVELGLWPDPKDSTKLQGYLYLSQHDCLMQTNAYEYQSDLVIDFNSGGISNRTDNCKADLGNLSPRFQGSGTLLIDASGETFAARFQFLIMGISVVTGSGDPVEVSFLGKAPSPKFLEILTTYEHKFRQKPSKNFIDNVQK